MIKISNVKQEIDFNTFKPILKFEGTIDIEKYQDTEVIFGILEAPNKLKDEFIEQIRQVIKGETTND